MDLKTGHVCDRGLNPKRPVNQDRFLSVPERGLFAVFDGVGGQQAGEVASQTAAETIEEALAHTTADSSVELVSRAIRFANRDIFEMAESDPAYKTMATTVALLHIDQDRATVAHVGDSRVYRLEDGRFYRETVDHTDFNDAVKAGLLTRDQASSHGRSNVINRALGVDRDVEVEVKQITLRDGARFLLCSDGIYRHLSDEEIAGVLAGNKDPQRAADELKRLVHERGADDNLTAVVVQAGRARSNRVLAIEDVGGGALEKTSPRRRSAEAGAAVRSGRIQVGFGEPRLQRDSIDREMRSNDRDASSSEGAGKRAGISPSRVLMYVLLALVVLAGAFYAGLRASEWRNERASNANAETESLRIGQEAFERGDYQAAMTEFESLVQRYPQNATGLYWLGRAHLEQRAYADAAKDFEEALSREPRMFDAYVQAAAAYQALGEKAKAAQMLARYADERRKTERPAADSPR
ncbi:MAG TPA: protein phosphatase 2C domain-containing protein [Blastocatellia bacterium]|nr:protein phosphatase 2C domain-containing protein [Blastocatellia bacterium]